MAITGHTRFISITNFKAMSSVDDNLDAEIIKPNIITAQKLYLEPILSTDLYRKLQDDIDANTVSGNYKKLLDEYIFDTLMHYTMYQGFNDFNYRVVNKGIVTKSSDNSESIELAELKYLKNSILDTAQYFGSRLISYLCANSELFPEYLLNEDNDDIRPIDDDQNYFSGIYTGE